MKAAWDNLSEEQKCLWEARAAEKNAVKATLESSDCEAENRDSEPEGESGMNKTAAR
jgi:hypothetical protein